MEEAAIQQMLRTARRDRAEILADLLMRIFHDDDMYFDWSRSGYLTLDGGIVMTPEQMAALEDALLDYKVKED
jgi:hypothetical protein